MSQPADAIRELFEDYRHGRYARVARRCRRMLATHPRELRLLSLLAASCAELGEHEQAVEAYRAALALRPTMAKLHNGLGVTLLRLQRFEDAFASFREAVRQDPTLAEGHFNAGILLEHAERLEEALECFRTALACRAGYVEAMTAAGSVLRRLGRYDEALASLEAALQVRGDDPGAWRRLLELLERGNRQDELRDAVPRARDVLGAHPVVVLHEAILAEHEGDGGRARSLLESVDFGIGDESGLHDERRRLARLVRLCDRAGDVEGALGWARSANELSRRISGRNGIRKETFLRFVSRRRELSDDFAAVPAASGKGPSPVFVVGFPRSGTTLLDTLLRGHRGLQVVEESNAVGRMVTAMAGADDERLEHIAGMPADEIARARHAYVDALPGTATPAGDRTLVDRFALNIIYAAEIRQVFPDARFVLMLRHPADCVLSCFLQTFHESSANASFHTIEDAARLYDRVFDLWESERASLDPEVVTVRYEDLVERTEPVCRGLLEALGIPWDPAVLEHSRSARQRPLIETVSYDQVVRDVYGDAVGRWRRYRPAMEEALETLEPWIRRYGYSS